MKVFLISFMLMFCSVSSYALNHTVEVSQAQLQAEAEKIMPISKTVLFVTSVFSDPSVELSASTNTIIITTSVAISAQNEKLGNGRISLAGTLRYEKTSGAFYFDNVVVKSLTVEQIPNLNTSQIKPIVESLAKQLLPTYPIYTLDEKDVGQQMAKASLQSVTVKEKKLILVLDLFAAI